MKTKTRKQKITSQVDEKKKEETTPQNKVTVDDLKGKKVDAFPDNPADKPVDTLHR
jgi:hypothetical protein